jgi:tetratricopeptide (TPR) repeat protein
LAAAAALVVIASQGGVASAETPRPAPDPDKATYVALMRQGIDAVKGRRPAEGLPLFDQIDRHYQALYPPGAHVVCSHGPSETLIYLTRSAAQNVSSVAIDGLWCDAIYFKAYALIDLNRPQDAERELDRALSLAPDNPQYLNEKGQLLSMAKRWDEAIAIFKRAEDDHVYAPSGGDSLAMQSRACRGVGYALTEQRKLDEAEANYRRCLTIDPDDEKSKNELRYIAQLRQAH